MIKITDKTKCSGCGACAQICPQKCISMQEDKEGFLYPIVDTNKCVDCGRCDKVCQYVFPFDSKKEPIHTYAYVCRDSKVRSESSSGGVFTIIANYFLSKGGVVYGAAFDSEWNVFLTSTSTRDGLCALRKSKYVQAKVGNIYANIKDNLIKDQLVLFVSTPCQVNGLKHYLGKEYNNLFTIDFTCHGIPSPMVWRDYIKKYKKKGVSYINFRNKTANGWNNYSLHIKNGKENTIILQGNKQNLYMRGFLQDLFCRPSCSNCVSRKFSTNSDIMIGDFWNVESYHRESILNDNQGVSLCMTLTEKGQQLIKSIESEGFLFEVPFTEAEINASHSCIVHSFPQHRLRGLFFYLYNILPLRLLIWFCIVPYNFFRRIYSLIVLQR